MRILTIILTAAFVFLLTQQLTSADDRRGHEGRGASQAVVNGDLLCDPVSTGAALNVDGGLGVLAIPNPNPEANAFGLFIDHDEDCSALLPALAEQARHRTCEFSDVFENGSLLRVEYVCTGGSDAVISAIGEIAKALIRLGQT